MCFLGRGGLSNDDIGMARGIVFQEIRGRELVSKQNRRFRLRKVGGLP